MKAVRLLGCLLAILLMIGLVVVWYGYGDVFIPLLIAIPTIFAIVFLSFYTASLVFTDSFTALPRALINFLRK